MLLIRVNEIWLIGGVSQLWLLIRNRVQILCERFLKLVIRSGPISICSLISASPQRNCSQSALNFRISGCLAIAFSMALIQARSQFAFDQIIDLYEFPLESDRPQNRSRSERISIWSVRGDFIFLMREPSEGLGTTNLGRYEPREGSRFVYDRGR